MLKSYESSIKTRVRPGSPEKRKKTKKGENEERRAKKRNKKKIKKRWNFIEKRDPKRAQLKGNSEVKKEVKKGMAKSLSHPEIPWGAAANYEGNLPSGKQLHIKNRNKDSTRAGQSE